jgi:hypothetical protein
MDHEQFLADDDKHSGPELWHGRAGGRISIPVLPVAISVTACRCRSFSGRRKYFSANPVNRLRSQPIGERQVKN